MALSPEPTSDAPVELTVVIPCLNEADTLGICLAKAWKGIRAAHVQAEIVVADNGSTDGSIEIAHEAGARVVAVAAKGYGSALMGGIEAARGAWIIMGDADDSYDFLAIPLFVEKLRQGFDLVQGCRLPAGGGTVLPGAMPLLHRRLGNPLFTWLVRSWFRAPIHDVYCGLRGFTRALYDRLEQRCTGMEFATEMIIKSSLYQEAFGLRIAEVPITLHPDGRKAHAPHLRTFRDGWRTLRFFMLYCPRWLYLVPGLGLILAGLGLGGLVYTRTPVAGVVFDAHTLLVASLLIIMGYQSLLFGAFAKVFGVDQRLLPPTDRVFRMVATWTLERGVAVGLGALGLGLGLIAYMASDWFSQGFGPLDYAQTMRVVIPGVMLATIGFQTVLGSFFVSILRLTTRS